MNLNSSSKKSPQSLRERFREQSNQAMLAAAEQVFAEQGLHGASMQQIAERAGVAVGTLYNHFKDREALLDALRAQRRLELLGRLDRSHAELQKEPFRIQLEGFLLAMFQHLDEHRQFLSIALQSEHERAGKHNETMRELYARIERLVKVGLKQKALRTGPDALYSAFLMGVIKGTFMREKYVESNALLADQVGTVADFFLHGAGK